MSLKIGIVGLPNVGKSTLFSALTRKKVDISNYPFCTIEPNIGIVEVPDPRVEKLAEFSHSKKIIHAVVEFVDIAGLVKGAAEGEGLGNKFLSHIKGVDAIAQVIRLFEDKDIISVSEKIDPLSDLQTIELELIMKDLETVEKRLETGLRQVRGGDKTALAQKEVLERLKNALQKGERTAEILKEDRRPETLRLSEELGLLSAKPRIIIFNCSEDQVKVQWKPAENILKDLKNDPWIILSAKVENEANELSPEEKLEYLETLGLKESGLDQLIKIGYKTLDLITFLTTGEDETRAWTIPAGSSAPRAGRAIHSDFEEKFIRAEIIPYEKLMEAGSRSKARELGWLKIEGKEYIVKDGDVVEFKI